MGKDSNIQWTGNTVNFWHGCKKVSPGCKYCYMYRDKARWHQDGSKVIKSTPVTFNAALKWPEPTKIFTCSYSDFFIEQADQWRAEAWEIIRKTPHHTWQILTKRPERIKQCLPEDWGTNGYPNVWRGTSVENQKTADERIPLMLQTPAAIHFISVEPLLEEVNLHLEQYNNTDNPSKPKIDWVIVGGESGHGSIPEDSSVKFGYRQCFQTWILSIINQCKKAGVPCFVKQLGTDGAKVWKLKSRHGGDMEEWPADFQVREFPAEKPISDQHILMFYHLGWDHQSNHKRSIPVPKFSHDIFQAAYVTGQHDFIAGDDISTIDEKSNQQILTNIKLTLKAILND